MEEEVNKGSSLSWRSRDTSWWTSAVDLSSTLLSKMDQVPGFAMPWHAGGRGETKQAQAETRVQGGQRGGEFAGFWTEGCAGANKPVEMPKPKSGGALRAGTQGEDDGEEGGSQLERANGEIGAHSSSGRLRVGESRRRTKRMPVDVAPDGPKQDSSAPVRSKRLSAVSQEFLLGSPNPKTRVTSVESISPQLVRASDSSAASIRRVDVASILLSSSRRGSGRHHSSRSLCHGHCLEDTIRNNPPHALPQPPGCDGVVRVIRGEVGGSFRMTTTTTSSSSSSSSSSGVGDAIAVSATASLPTSPCLTSHESRASKLLRKFKLPSITSRANHEIVSNSGSDSLRGVRRQERGSSTLVIASKCENFAKSLESRRQGIVTDVEVRRPPTIQSECIVGGSGDYASAGTSQGFGHGAADVGGGKKKRSSRWLFKWRWGGKGQAHAQAQAREVSPTAEIMSDARDTFYSSQSDRYSSERVANLEQRRGSGAHRRGSSWGCASLASTTVSTPVLRRHSRIHQDDMDAGDAMVFESRAGSRDFESFRSLGCSFRSSGGQSFRSNGGQSFRKGGEGEGELAFEDCHGSFRSIASGGSCASFRSVEEIEWDSRLPPPLPADQNLTIGDVAALCNSSLKFVFKCREVHYFNKFLRSQKRRLLAENSGGYCFNVIHSGTDIEVSSMVAAMAYAWFLDNTVPKVTGATWHAVPMIDMPRHQMHKHKSAAWLFDACGIDAAALLYADEMELGSLVAAGRVKSSVVGQDLLVTRNAVGSVCTLLGEKLAAEAQCLLEPRYMKTLLLAGVLVDTENLDFASMRDTEMTTTLLVGSGSLGRNGFFDQLRGVEDDDRVSKFITRNYGDGKQLSGRKTGSAALKSKIQQEAEQEQSDKDSLFTQSQDHTSTSEAGTNSSLDEDSPRLKQRSSFKYTKLPLHSAPARSHPLPSPSCAGCTEDGKAGAHIRKAATQLADPKLPAGENSSPNVTRIRRTLFLYHA